MELSVVVPVYNVERYLPKCLESLTGPGKARLDKGLPPGYEIYLIDDGSTDSCKELCQSYARELPGLVHSRRIENSGQGQARNIGLELCQGDYVYFIDSDDYLAPGGMEKLLSLAEEGGADIFIFDSIAVNSQGRELKYMKGVHLDRPLDLAHRPELLLEGPDVWNKLIRRGLFMDKGLRFPPRVWFEDLATIPKLYAFTESISYVPQALHRYLQRPGSVTNTTKAERNLEIIAAVDELISFYRAQGRYDELEAVLERLAFHSQFLTSSVRVNLAKFDSPVQDALREDFIKKFPRWRENEYIENMSPAHKLLTFLLMHRMYRAVHLLMGMNDKRKRKKL